MLKAFLWAESAAKSLLNASKADFSHNAICSSKTFLQCNTSSVGLALLSMLFIYKLNVINKIKIIVF